MGERVATVDVKVAMANVIHKREAGNWGPNATFRFPTWGGTGGIWKRVGKLLPAERQHYNQTVVGLDADAKVVTLASGATIRYNKLLSTMALDYTLSLVVRTVSCWALGSASWVGRPWPLFSLRGLAGERRRCGRAEQSRAEQSRAEGTGMF